MVENLISDRISNDIPPQMNNNFEYSYRLHNIQEQSAASHIVHHCLILVKLRKRHCTVMAVIFSARAVTLHNLLSYNFSVLYLNLAIAGFPFHLFLQHLK